MNSPFKKISITLAVLMAGVVSVFAPHFAAAQTFNQPTDNSNAFEDYTQPTGSLGGNGNSQPTGSLGGDGNSAPTGSLGGNGDSQPTGSFGNSKFVRLANPLQFNSIGDLITGFVDIFTYIVIVLAILMIIYIGLRLVLAQGNADEIKERKEQLLWLLVGVGIVIGARVIIAVVINTIEATGLVKPGTINTAKNAIR